MTLYLFDYNGTLDTLPDPVAFIEALRERDPGCSVVIMSGETPPEAVQKAADSFWMKPFPVQSIIALKPERVVVVDDEPYMRRALDRIFTRRRVSVTLMEPKDLISLLGG